MSASFAFTMTSTLQLALLMLTALMLTACGSDSMVADQQEEKLPINTNPNQEETQSPVEEEEESLPPGESQELPEGITVPVRGIIIFTHPDVRLDTEHTPVPALRAAELKRWLRRNPLYPKLSAETRNAILSVFNADQDKEESTA